MKKHFTASAILISALLAGCSKESSVAPESISSEVNTNSSKIEKATREGEVNFDRETLISSQNLLLQKGPTQNPDSVDYYSLQSETLENGSLRLTVSTVVLRLSMTSPQSFDGRTNVSEIRIEADKVIISKELSFPGSKVIIKANELVFTGSGKITTTPPSAQTGAGFGQDGVPGKNGGDIVLDVKKLDLGGSQLRFDLTGAKGQDAGRALAGNNGRDIPVIAESNIIQICENTVGRECPGDLRFKITPMGDGCRGTTLPPTSGTDAAPSGLPGAGGNGGNLYLTQSLMIESASFKSDKGIQGTVAPVEKGGRAGTPRIAIARNITTNLGIPTCHHRPPKNGTNSVLKIDNQIFSTTSSKDIVLATTVEGKDSELRTLSDNAKNGNQFTELPSFYTEITTVGKKLTHKLDFAKDLFRNNYFNESRIVLEEVINELATSEKSVSNELLLNETEATLHLLNSNRDFNGMLLNQMPVLSFEATSDIYKNSVKTSLDTIAFVENMKKKVSAVGSIVDELKKNRAHVSYHVDTMVKKYNDAYASIPSFKIKLAEYENSRTILEDSLAKVEAQIIEEANRNIHSQERKKKLLGGLKLIAKLAQISPLGAPASQVIGKSLETVIDLSQNKNADWMDIMKEGYGVYDDMKNIEWDKSHDDWNSKYKEFDTDLFKKANGKIDSKKFMAYLKNVNNTTKPMQEEIKKYYKDIYSQKVPANAYEAEVQRIKDIHPMFKELTSKLADLQEKKTEVDGMLSQLTSDMTIAQSEIVKDYAMMVSLEDQEASTVDGLNFTTDEILTRMGKTAKLRLEKYKGSLVKAYVYRTLMPFPGNPNLEKLNTQLVRFAKVSGKEISALDLETTYNEEIEEVLHSLHDYVESGKYKEFESDYSLELNDKQMQALSERKMFYINLANEKDLFEDKENVRIVSIELDDLSTTEFKKTYAELIVAHTGNSVLSRDGKDYQFASVADKTNLWMTKIDLTNNLTELIRESDNNRSLVSSITASDVKLNTLIFNQVGAKGIFAVKLKSEDAKLSRASLKIKYSYSLKH
jgi:hypothetical protein